MKLESRAIFLLILWRALVLQDCTTVAAQREQNPRATTSQNNAPLFWETIEKRAKQANLDDLRSRRLPEGGLEIRVWVGFGKKPLEGFILQRIAGEWSATFLESTNRTTQPPYQKTHLSPKSGWEKLWGSLTREGILTLPDQTQLEGEAEMVLDGTSYVVEIKEHQTYRTYAYENPDYQRWPEARRMLKIAELLYTEFGIQRYPLPENKPNVLRLRVARSRHTSPGWTKPGCGNTLEFE